MIKMRWMISDDTDDEWDENMLNLEENLEEKFRGKNNYNNLEEGKLYGK